MIDVRVGRVKRLPTTRSLASRIPAIFQNGDIHIPDHRPLIDDLHSMQRTITIAGNIRYAAPRDAGGHADRWTALALHAAGNAPAEWVWIPRPPRPRSRREMMRRY